MAKKWLKRVLLGAAALLLAIQLVPYGRAHTNPPVTAEPSWPDPSVRGLAQRACFDCHSNQTKWTWYTSVAPASWLVQYDVDKGRRELNFSEWDRPQKEAKEAPEAVIEDEMPPPPYVLLHPDAVLTPSERRALAEGLRQMVGADEVAAAR
jgi:Haem-binding domain